MNHILRTLPPAAARPLAMDHDRDVLAAFIQISGLPSEEQWDPEFQGIHYSTWVSQARLPLRLAGMGLRVSQRTSPAAYWASWADALPGLLARFPAIGRRRLHHLTAAEDATGPVHPDVPTCVEAGDIPRAQRELVCYMADLQVL